jgi:hypothetical protein
MKLVIRHNLVLAANGALPQFSICLHEVVTDLQQVECQVLCFGRLDHFRIFY